MLKTNPLLPETMQCPIIKPYITKNMKNCTILSPKTPKNDPLTLN